MSEVHPIIPGEVEQSVEHTHEDPQPAPTPSIAQFCLWIGDRINLVTAHQIISRDAPSLLNQEHDAVTVQTQLLQQCLQLLTQMKELYGK